MNSLILEEYNPRWPELFDNLRLRMSTLLDGMPAAIEHIGSTAVPGLLAKPVIDIDLLLRAATDLPLVVSKLASLGYAHRGDLGITGREAFRAPPNDLPHHLYVCPPGSLEYKRHILFRDYLRSHLEEAKTYARLKRELARKFGDDRDAYTQGKSSFVATILGRADKTATDAE
jgi:GrpB-like predicted nucleotidyltransferase (UPF0157 family)